MKLETGEDWVKVIEIWKNSKTSEEFSKSIGVSEEDADSIISRIQNNDYPIPGVEYRKKKPTDRYIPVLIAMSKNSLDEVGKMLGLSRQRVDQLYKQYKIERTDNVFEERIKRITNRKAIVDVFSLTLGRKKSAAKLGLSVPELVYACKMWGIKIPKRVFNSELEKDGKRKCYVCKKILPKNKFYGKSSICIEDGRENAKKNYMKQTCKLYVITRKDGGFLKKGTGPDVKFVADNGATSYMSAFTNDIAEARVFLKTQHQSTRRWGMDDLSFIEKTSELIEKVGQEEILNRILFYGKPIKNSGRDTSNIFQAVSGGERTADVTQEDSSNFRPIPIDGPSSVPA